MAEISRLWVDLRGRALVWSCHQVWWSLEIPGFRITKDNKMWVNFYLNRFWYTQQTSRWISLMQFQDCSSGSSLRYALNRFQNEDSLLKFDRRPSALLWPHWMYSSRAQSRTWTSSSPFWVALDPQAMVWKWYRNRKDYQHGKSSWKAYMLVTWLEAAESYSRNGVFLHWCCIPGEFSFNFRFE